MEQLKINTMKILKYHSDVIDIIFSNYIKEFKFSVDYYSNLHDPEFIFKRGVSIESKLETALKNYEDAKFTAKISKQILKKETEINCLDNFKFLEAIKQGIREQMKFAYDYSENKYIVIKAYKRAIKLLQVLNLNSDKYQSVTARYFLNYN